MKKFVAYSIVLASLWATDIVTMSHVKVFVQNDTQSAVTYDNADLLATINPGESKSFSLCKAGRRSLFLSAFVFFAEIADADKKNHVRVTVVPPRPESSIDRDELGLMIDRHSDPITKTGDVIPLLHDRVHANPHIHYRLNIILAGSTFDKTQASFLPEDEKATAGQ